MDAKVRGGHLPYNDTEAGTSTNAHHSDPRTTAKTRSTSTSPDSIPRSRARQRGNRRANHVVLGIRIANIGLAFFGRRQNGCQNYLRITRSLCTMQGKGHCINRICMIRLGFTVCVYWDSGAISLAKAMIFLGAMMLLRRRDR